LCSPAASALTKANLEGLLVFLPKPLDGKDTEQGAIALVEGTALQLFDNKGADDEDNVDEAISR
jgi:hypothetical protein